jgi:hypothetical protein
MLWKNKEFWKWPHFFPTTETYTSHSGSQQFSGLRVGFANDNNRILILDFYRCSPILGKEATEQSLRIYMQRIL